MHTAMILVTLAILASFTVGLLVGRRLHWHDKAHERAEAQELRERADAAAAALEGFSRVGGQLLPLPTDKRWEKTRLGALEIPNIVHLDRDRDEKVTVRVGGDYLIGDKLPDSTQLQSWARAVIAAYRERVVRKSVTL